MQNRTLNFIEAINEAFDQVLEAHPEVFIIGEGVPDPKAIFGSTKGLYEKYGPSRVMDMPVAENGLTGIAIGAAVTGLRPILIHQRIDFSLYALDQVINNAAKWYSMYGGQKSCPLVIRLIVGKGWGQGNQHSQNLQSLYAHIPGLKVVVPATAYDAKGLMVAAVRDPNPVIYIEHRWLHHTISVVPKEIYEVPIGKADVFKPGTDITLVTWSSMRVESSKAIQHLEADGISVEAIDLKSLTPLDYNTINKSLTKTGRLIVVDQSWRNNGFAGEILARACEDQTLTLKTHPVRITLPDFPSPSTPGLCQFYYPGVREIYEKCHGLMEKNKFGPELNKIIEHDRNRHLDVPDSSFKGPF